MLKILKGFSKNCKEHVSLSDKSAIELNKRQVNRPVDEGTF